MPHLLPIDYDNILKLFEAFAIMFFALRFCYLANWKMPFPFFPRLVNKIIVGIFIFAMMLSAILSVALYV